MITVKYVGMLGNNLFQYSLGRILAEEINLQLICRPIHGFKNTFKKIAGKNIVHNPTVFRDHVLKSDGRSISVQEAVQSADNGIVLDGWFQRYEYYKPYKGRIRKWLEIEDLDVGQTENDIIVHLRMGDCILGALVEHPYIMPPEYFQKALNSTSFDKLYVCSDSKTLDHSLFYKYMEKFSEYNPILLGGDTLEDFRAIKSFNKIIMSMSTFSWWGAFLSKASEIFVPVPMAGHHTNEWSLESKNVALFVDDEDRYKYIKQYDDEWLLVNLQDIPER